MAAKQEWKWVACDGVGYDKDRDECHYVVLMHSFHSGTNVIGPFLSDDAAHKWVREHADGEMYSHFGNARVEGVTFYVQHMSAPKHQSYK